MCGRICAPRVFLVQNEVATEALKSTLNGSQGATLEPMLVEWCCMNFRLPVRELIVRWSGVVGCNVFWHDGLACHAASSGWNVPKELHDQGVPWAVAPALFNCKMH